MQAGLYLVHKSVGETSFQHVARFVEAVRAAGIRPDKLPACHGGALDPFAEGLLLLLAGPATRLMERLHAVPKSYEAELVWGAETDSGDGLGKVVHTGDAASLTGAALDAALLRLLGWTEQVPPAHSNKRVDGERAYAKAHRGEEVQLAPVRVYLHAARWLRHELPRRSLLSLTCRGGYYVRALARDLGRALGCGAHLSTLRRTSIGPWSDPPPGERVLVRGAELLPWCPGRLLGASEARALASRKPLPLGELQVPPWPLPPGFPGEEPPPVRALHEGRLLGLLRERAGALHVETLLGAGL